MSETTCTVCASSACVCPSDQRVFGPYQCGPQHDFVVTVGGRFSIMVVFSGTSEQCRARAADLVSQLVPQSGENWRQRVAESAERIRNGTCERAWFGSLEIEVGVCTRDSAEAWADLKARTQRELSPYGARS